MEPVEHPKITKIKRLLGLRQQQCELIITQRLTAAGKGVRQVRVLTAREPKSVVDLQQVTTQLDAHIRMLNACLAEALEAQHEGESIKRLLSYL